MKRLAIFDTSICSGNIGDRIIMNAVNKELESLLPDSFFFRLPTHDYLSEESYKILGKTEFNVLGGTNLLSSNMDIYNQWKVNESDIGRMGRVVLMGVGWWQYQSTPNSYTKNLLLNILDRNIFHSVRDNYTKQQLNSIGINNVINTGCPTMWNLSEQFINQIPNSKSDNVVTTLTDYKANPKIDSTFLLLLKKNYKKVYLWLQGAGDFEYFQKLNINHIDIIGPNLCLFDELLNFEDNLEYVGTRLHAGIHALNNGKRSIICAVDNRAAEISKDTGLPIISRKDIAEDNVNFDVNTNMDIKIPIQDINSWKKKVFNAQHHFQNSSTISQNISNQLNDRIELSETNGKVHSNSHSREIHNSSVQNRPLKVLSISTSDFGGAGKAALRIHEGLISNHIDATLLVLNTAMTDPNIKAFPSSYSGKSMVSALPISKDFSQTKILYDHWHYLMKNFPSRPEGLELFTDTKSLVHLGQIKEVSEADILHFHWVAGVIDYKELPTSIAGKPIVWTLHDMNPFTGGCHYAGDCINFVNQCGACPQLGSTKEKDLSRQIWMDKKAGINNLDLTVVTPSKWLGKCAQESNLFKNFPLCVIANGLPTNIFKVCNAENFRKHFDIPDSDKIVLFGAAAVTTQRKGFSYLLQALIKLSSDPSCKSNLHLVVFGNLPKASEMCLPFPLTSTGHIRDEHLLAELYSAADVFVTPSLEDNLPNTAIEAMACGTPVVGFNTGGLSDIITHLKTGYLAPKGDADKLAEGIQWVLESIDTNGVIMTRCREYAKSNYDQNIQAKAYIDLYNKILENHKIFSNGIQKPTLDRIDKHPKHCFTINKFEAAKEKLKAIIRKYPEDASAHNEAKAFCDCVLQHHPTELNAIKLMDRISKYHYSQKSILNQENLYQKAKELIDLNKIHEAIALMEKYVSETSNFAQLHNDIAVLSYSIDDYDKTLIHYRHATEMEPENPLFQKNLADFLYFVQKDTASALKTYTTLLERNPEDTEILYAIGCICTELGNVEDANYFFNRILEIDPSHRDALHAIDENQKLIIENSKISVTKPNEIANQNDLSQTNTPVLVSAIVSAYNAERYIQGCLEDLLAQSIADKIEIIVLDSGSQQNEASIVRFFQQQYQNIHYIRTEKRETVYAAWNRGIKASRGKYITNANTDDRHKHDAFEIMVRTLDQRADIALVYADCLITETENGRFDNCKPVGAFKWHDWDREHLLHKGCFMGPQPMWRRSIHDEYGYFDPNFITSGDYEFWLRISQTHDFQHIPQYLGLYLRSPQSIEHRNRNKQVVENQKLLKMYRTAAKQKRIIRRKEKSCIIQEKTIRNVATSIQPIIEFVEKENYGIAKTQLTNLIANHPDHWEAYELLVDVMLQSGQEAGISHQLRPLEEHSDLPALVLALIGCGYEATNDLERAGAFADQALSIDSECARACTLKGVIAYRNGNPQDATRLFQKASECNSDWGDPWTNMGTIHWDRGAHEKALDCYEKGFHLSPTAPNVATTYHIAISEAGLYERAKPFFEAAVEHHPDFRKARFLLIDILIRMEAYQEALNQIEAVLVRFGADPQLIDAAKAVRGKVGPMKVRPGNHPALSLCMIVKNEERYLPRCLESLKPIVDEMIIVDTGSTDSTRDIAEVFGAKVFDYEWQDDFAAARNYSLEQASGDWILVMDADEVIAAQDYDVLINLLQNTAPDKSTAYMMVTRNYTDRKDSMDWVQNLGEYSEERSTGWVPSKKVRLFRNHQGIHFVFPVHEQVDPVITEMGSPLIECPIAVHHYGKLDHTRTLERWQMYYDIGKEKLKSYDYDLNAIKEMAIQAALLSKWMEAATYWKQYLDRKPNSVDACMNLTRVLAEKGDFKQSNRYAQKAYRLSSDRPETIYNLTLSELQAGQAHKAVKTAARMVVNTPNDKDSRVLHAIAEICAGNVDGGFSKYQILMKNTSKESLLMRTLSIISSIRSAGFEEWVATIVKIFSQIDGLQDIGKMVTGLSAQNTDSISKISIVQDIKSTKFFNDACRNYEREDYGAAFESLSKTIATQPNHWEAYRLLVDVMLISGQGAIIPEKLRPLEDFSNVPAWVLALIGSGYEAAGNFFRALEFADQAITMDSDCAYGWNLKGVITYRRQNPEAAVGFFQKASDCDATWGEPWTNLGTIFWEQGSSDKALNYFEKGFSLSPTAPNVATTYHIAVNEKGLYERAKPFFVDAIKRYPDFLKARFLLIDILIRLKTFQPALDQIGAVMAKQGNDPQLLEAAKAVRSEVGPISIKKNKHRSLSLCMIVKNEERYLARCLESLKPVVDEMIVVDTGSIDSTRDIANIFGAKVFDFEWNDDFAAARNYSIEQASGDWILVMDADEVIATRDHKNIRKFLARTNSKNQAFMFVTRNYTNRYNIIGWEPNAGRYPNEEEGAGWTPSEKVRLFHNDKDIRFEYPVHEVVGPALYRKGIPVKLCPYPVHHYGKMDQTIDRQKDERYYKIGMDKLSSSPDDPVAIREMAVQAAKLQKYEDSIVFWKKLIEIQPNNTNAYINISSNYGQLKQYRKAKKAAQTALKIDPKIKEGHLNLGMSELHLGNIKKAENIFHAIANKYKTYYSVVFFLGASQFCQGKIENGVKTLQPLRDTAMWASLSYTIQELVESLMAAGDSEASRNLIIGADKLNCSNNAIEEHRQQLETKAA